MSDNQPWEPLGMLDFFVLGMVSTFQLVALGVCAHLVKWRKWPPYLTKNVDVVIISTFAGILWTATKAIEVGFVRRRAGDLLAACDFEVGRSRARHSPKARFMNITITLRSLVTP
ncbi:hypothetical protein Esi_0123_0031 [Ectocarpus siliculosus]|uniref:Uncharacterized protein n=1 Tax=Ectocarpus siliculosus TaxID=2880 RepID=D7FIS2_ECTSI|nr:hypothetical protein Esi_0123_0031 [Ectocarpus siliculosus]|eukprot:CBJ28889.1 hypothetical protein Esi_0123_0031 [Ectocarpus siliculosus]